MKAKAALVAFLKTKAPSTPAQAVNKAVAMLLAQLAILLYLGQISPLVQAIFLAAAIPFVEQRMQLVLYKAILFAAVADLQAITICAVVQCAIHALNAFVVLNHSWQWWLVFIISCGPLYYLLDGVVFWVSVLAHAIATYESYNEQVFDVDFDGLFRINYQIMELWLVFCSVWTFFGMFPRILNLCRNGDLVLLYDLAVLLHNDVHLYD